jgi:glucosamine-6-phosphate deaminase
MATHDPSRIALSSVEQVATAASPLGALYAPTEKIPTIVVDNFPALGKLAAMRFLEWAQQNPGGVITLPTGKTPEHFIKWVRHVLKTWGEPDTQKTLEQAGVDPATRPDMRSLHFVQIDEFYPINPSQHNSFIFYVRRFYIQGFGLDPAKAMLIDCSEIGLDPGDTLETVWPEDEVDLSLRFRPGKTFVERKQKEVLERIDQWCLGYEDRIRSLGGIGFFLGGIGPDGHIGFNVRGSDHHSTTRLAHTNYETQAAAAGDLGGIEVSRKRLVITIGLGTITHNHDCTALVIAAGEAKAGIVAAAVEQDKHILHPASALHALPNARLYITKGAAKLLGARQLDLLQKADTISDVDVQRVLTDLAAARNRRLTDLCAADFASDPQARCVIERRTETPAELAEHVHRGLIAKVQVGSQVLSGTRFFHTEPHHDDLMLGCLPSIVRHMRDPLNTHHFVCLTSGFTAVTNQYMQTQLGHLRQFIDSPEFAELSDEGYFHPDNDKGRQRDVWQYLDGVAYDRQVMRAEGVARRVLRNLIGIYDEFDLGNLKERMDELEHYFRTAYPGKKDLEHIQRLKGMCREWEAECLWGYFGYDCSHVYHLRLGFYTGDIFTQDPTLERDVLPVLKLLERIEPDVVTVALDPEASGPDTHYKVLQAVSGALRRYEQSSGRSDIKVWGYRNVWYRFHPSEASLCIPVSMNMFSVMHSAFMNTFISQKDASFPSHEHDGPFCELAQKIQVEQYQKLKTCLGREWFHQHPSAMIRATRGLVFLREMTLAEFYQHSRELKQLAENR